MVVMLRIPYQHKKKKDKKPVPDAEQAPDHG